MKKLTTGVLALVLSSSLVVINAQEKKNDSTGIKTKKIEGVLITGALGLKKSQNAQTSSQQVVTAEDLNQAGNQNAVQALTGKVSGLQITQTNSGVSASTSIRLRGSRSITGNNEALVVIDGVISSASVLASLPPDVIESTNVIKGAQGAALYGSDGVNGVVIVTTKRGARRGISVIYNGVVDFQQVAYLPKRQTKYGQGWDGERYSNENGAWGPAFDGSMTSYGVPLYDVNGDGTIDTNGIGGPDEAAMIHRAYEARPDELKKFFRTGSIFSNDLTINAGSQGKYALLNLSHSRNSFVIEGDKSDRTSVLFKAGAKEGRWSVDGSLNYIRRVVRQAGGSIYRDLLQSSTDAPITAYKGSPDAGYAWNIYYKNPYWFLKHDRDNSMSNFFAATASLGYELNDHINIKYTGNLRNSSGRVLNYRDALTTSQYSGNLAELASTIYTSNSNSLNYYGDLLVNFNYDLTDDLELSATLGNNYQDSEYTITSAGGSNLDIPGLYTIANATKPTQPSSLSNFRTRNNGYAFFANLDLNYKNYLFFNATGRKEYASILPKDNNSYFYPSAGVSFIPTKAWDGFGGDVLTYMKVSANWARVGNSSNIGTYSVNQSAIIGPGFPYTDYISFVNPSSITSPNVKPEFVTSKEVNLNLGFFKDRITLGSSFFRQDTKDLITSVSASSASGISSLLTNISSMKNEGFEIDLGFKPIKTRNVKWDMNLSYYTAQSTIEKVSEDSNEVPLLTSSTVGIYAQEGQLFPLIKVNKMKRNEDGKIVVDQFGNPLYTADLENAGVGTPKHIFGLVNSLEVYGFRLGAVLDYRTGHKFYSFLASNMAFNGSLVESAQIDRANGGFIMPNSVYLDSTTGNYVDNTTIKTGGENYPSLVAYYSSIYNRIGENFVFDASAFKVRELSLSYTVDRKLLKTAGINELTLGVHARNPFVKLAKDNLNYADPETSVRNGNAKGIAGSNQYPNLRTYGVSLNVKF